MIGAPKEFQKKLLRWFVQHRRDLPWRVPPGSSPQEKPDAYFVLVSEAMLQQTQVSTVIPYFKRFTEAFPTIHALAAADEQAVLRLWQGLGYYSRARNLRSAARAIVEQFAGQVPSDVTALKNLPGIGRYTAGAIASLAFDKRAPILDGNVVRVVTRIDGIRDDPRERSNNARLWQRAEDLLPSRHAGDFNSALMELGATICTPKQPKCLLCPVRESCTALAEGIVDQIPPPKKTRPTPLNRRSVICAFVLKAKKLNVLIEQRPATGRWAGMWQFITFEAPAGNSMDWKLAEQAIGDLADRRHIAQITHQLTHRKYEFEVHSARCVSPQKLTANRQWVTLDRLSDYPLPRPHLLIAKLITEQLSQSPPFARPARQS